MHRSDCSESWLLALLHQPPLLSLQQHLLSLYTHLYYYSLSLYETTFKAALPAQDQLPLLANFSAVAKSDNPSVKTLVSVATDDHQTNSSNAAFSAMAADPSLRSTIISSAIELATAHRFDGMDLAWQFPSSPADMPNLAILLAEWSAGVNNAAKDLATKTLNIFVIRCFSSGIL